MTKLFLLDDHHIVRLGLRSVLEAAGHEVVGDESSTLGVLDTLKRLDARILILDIHLKGESGIELFHKIQAENINISVVVLSMSAEPRHVSEALRLGAMGYVLKGSPAAELLNAIAFVEQGRRFLSPQIASIASNNSNFSNRDTLSLLSKRELEILKFVVNGRTSAYIASQLFLSPKTVDTYRSRIMTKLDLNDVPSLVRFAIQRGLIDL